METFIHQQRTPDIPGFHQLLSCCHRFTHLARPLQQLTVPNTLFTWTPEHHLALDTLHTAILTTSVLQYPDFNKPFILDTGASTDALWCCALST